MKGFFLICFFLTHSLGNLSAQCTAVPGQIDIEGTVYEDLNENGAIDVGEVGETGIPIQIYLDANSDGLVDGGDSQVGTATTDGTGFFSYTLPPSTGSVTEDFSSGNLSGGVGWDGDWITTGSPTMTGGQVRLDDDEALYRTINMVSTISATISLDYGENGSIGTTDRLVIEICSDATFGTCQTLVDVSDDFTSGTVNNVSINTNILTATTTLRMRVVNYNGFGDYAFMDNVSINYTNPVSASYVMAINTSALASDVTLTTDNVETATFTALGEKDCDNDFGYKLTDSDGDNVPDRNDLDDDNDGILDIDEGQFTVGAADLNVVSAIPPGTFPGDPAGLRLSDAGGQLFLDIYLGPNSTPGEAVAFNTSTGEIGGTNPSGTLTNTEVVELVYTTENSPIQFDFQSITINNIQSLDGIASPTGVRDAFVWGESGTWTPIGTPAGAVVSVDPGASDKVGSFVLEDPDGGNDLTDINTFSAPYNVDNTLSDVLLNMAGTINGHTVGFDFVAPQSTASLYVFNSGGSSAYWEFLPQLSVEINRTLGPDTDQDGIPDYLDLDSDGDGCADAVEGAGSFSLAALVDASGTDLDGGNTGTGYTGTAGPFVENLGTTSEQTDPALLGVPIVAPATTAVTQGVGESINDANAVACLDTDGDGIVDSEDSNSTDPCVPAQAPLYTGYDAMNATWAADDCDGDGVLNGQEDTDGTDPYDINDFLDADGDGVADTGVVPDTDPADPCVPAQAPLYTGYDATNATWAADDCDGDGVLNGQEDTDGTDPYDINDFLDADGDGVADTGVVPDTDPADPCVPAQAPLYTGYDSTNAIWQAGNCDGDSVLNGQEHIDGTDPYSTNCSAGTDAPTLIRN